MDTGGSAVTGDDGPRETVSAVAEKRFLVGFMDEEPATGLLGADPSDDRDPKERYERARAAVDPIDRSLSDPPVADLPDGEGFGEHVAAFRETPGFRALLDGSSRGDWRLGLVPVDALVAIQTGVEVGAHRDVPTWSEDRIGLLRAALPLSVPTVDLSSSLDTPQHRRLGVQLTARSPNLAVTGKHVDHHEEGVDVTFEVRPKPNFVHVTRYRGRLLLRNGYHRAYQVVRAGGTRLPAVVRDVDDYAATGGAHTRNFDEDVAFSERPPLVVDYDSGAAATVLRPARNKVIRCVAETDWVPR